MAANKTKKKITKKKTAGKKTTGSKKTAVKKSAAPKKTAKKVGNKNVTKKKTSKKTATKKKTSKKATVKKVSQKKVTVKKTVTKKTSKKTAVKKATTKKTSPKKKAATKATVTDIKTKAPAAAKKTRIAPYKEKRGEDYMGTEQSDHFRQLLNSWKRELMEEVDRTVHHMQDEASNFPDPNDRATQEEEFALELRTRDRERKLIRKIDEALVSIDNGDYGYCEVCGIEIGIRRLEARPTATLCIDCKTLDEIKERQLG